jgi:Putative auto-transporter adhesin, head GIN domain
MKKTLLSLFLGIGAISLVAGQKTINDPNAQERAVSEFHGVSVSGSIDLYLTQADKESVVVSAADQKWANEIVTEVEDGVLHIYWKNQRHINLDWGNNPKRMKAYVAIKNVDYIATSGSGDVRLESTIKADKLRVGISGSGNLYGELAVKDLNIGLSGSADTKISGKAEKSSFHISGSGNIGTYDFSTDYCDVSISGSGDVYATINKELSASISGSGDIHIKGDGLIRDFRTSGSGKLKRTK